MLGGLLLGGSSEGIVCEQAYWGEVAREEWKTSVALSEIMLFQVLKQKR